MAGVVSRTGKWLGSMIDRHPTASATLVGGVAAPTAVTTGIAAVGFGVGSTAAGMMSSAAIASATGGVAAGSFVATCQAIGASGLVATVGTGGHSLWW
jgi:hypothetical protein